MCNFFCDTFQLFLFLRLVTVLFDSFLQPRVAERHFLDLRKKYGNVFAVDLVNTVYKLNTYNII